MSFHSNNLMEAFPEHRNIHHPMIIPGSVSGTPEVGVSDFSGGNVHPMMQTYIHNSAGVGVGQPDYGMLPPGMGHPLGQSSSLIGGGVVGSGPESMIGGGVGGPGSAAAAAAASNSRKPCNCNKSNCLKLYCECFSQGQLCQNCNCNNCMNNLMYEQERSRAVKMILERNPNAFHPKIGRGEGERKHTKGCNCKRSGCLKNYCECYEAKISCTELCRCQGCRNTEESLDRRSLLRLQALELSRLKFGTSVTKHLICRRPDTMPHSFLTLPVIESILHCLLGVATDCDRKELSMANHEKLIMAEFNKSVMEVIETASKSNPGLMTDAAGYSTVGGLVGGVVVGSSLHNDPLSGLFPLDGEDIYEEGARRRHLVRGAAAFTDEDLIDSENNAILA